MKQNQLIIGAAPEQFALPLSLVTQTQAILARKRSGKSYTASVQAEEMLDSHAQIGVIDPTGAWWGIKGSADGTGEGYPIVVFGGDHSDAPLDFFAGEAMAAAFVDHGFSAIFDVSNGTTEQQQQFVMDFCSALLRLNRNAAHIFMDEADTFAPQMINGKLEKSCLGTVSRLVKQGGIRGVGFTMITQRPAAINKNVLSQVDILTILRMSAPQDVKPVVEWLQSETTKEFAERVRTALPSLPVGTAFVASASLGIAERVAIRERRTFNSGATPEPGERKAEPTVLAKVDIQKLGQSIADSVKRAKEDTPEFLRKRINELEKQVAEKGTTDMGLIEDVKALHEQVAMIGPLTQRAESAEATANSLRGTMTEASRKLAEIAMMLGETDNAPVPMPVRDMPKTIATGQADGYLHITNHGDVPRSFTSPHGELSAVEAKILQQVADLAGIGVHSPTRVQVAFLAGYSNPRSGGFSEPCGRLVQRGLLQTSAGSLGITAEGRAQVGTVRPLTTAMLHQRIEKLLSGPEWKILSEIIRIYPASIKREELARRLGYSNHRSGGFSEPLSKLATMGFVKTSAGHVEGTELLFVKVQR